MRRRREERREPGEVGRARRVSTSRKAKATKVVWFPPKPGRHRHAGRRDRHEGDQAGHEEGGQREDDGCHEEGHRQRRPTQHRKKS